METKYSIKDLEHLSGIKAHTIRIWEQRYDIIQPQRTDTNIRYYLDDDLKRLLNISILVKNGIRISKVGQMSEKEMYEKVLELSSYKGDYTSQINSLKVAMLDYDQDLFEKVVNTAIFQMGAEDAFKHIIGNFILEVGLLWQTEAINVAHEHFISNLIRQKLFTAIDQIMVSAKASDAYILYLPDEELHELSLLYLYYYLRKNGKRVIYLGQSVPFQYLPSVLKTTGARNFVSVLTTRPFDDEKELYFKEIDRLFDREDCWFHFTGYKTKDVDYSSEIDPTRFRYYQNIEVLKNTILR
ncbi:MAG: MerR family transcriptional regulator [Flavobacteriales bacterium]|nr:MAG: MerR family transcriptional regulator [Flavobacteriales bacterium]